MYKKLLQLTTPLTILFILVNALFIVFSSTLQARGLDAGVVIVANLLLYALSMLNVYMQLKNLNNPNPRAMVRGVMVGTLLKLLVVASSVLIYLVIVGSQKNRPGVFTGMALYVIYTWFDVRISLRITQKK